MTGFMGVMIERNATMRRAVIGKLVVHEGYLVRVGYIKYVEHDHCVFLRFVYGGR